MTKWLRLLPLLALSLPALARAADAPSLAKVTYQDQVLPILRNACLNCHNPDKKKAGLDLSSYGGLMAGSDDRKVVKAGDPDASPLYRVMVRAEEPYMPKNADKLPDKDLAVFKAWIAQGAPETADSKVAVSAKPKNTLAAVAVAAGKPAGPPPMPQALPRVPLVHSPHPGALVSLAASPWAPLVAVGGQRQVLLYDTERLGLLGALPFPEGLPYVLKFSRNGQLLLAGGGQAAKSGKVIAWDVATGKRVLEAGDEFDSVLAADLTADQSMVALGGPAKVLKIYSTKDNQLLYQVKKHTDWVTAASFSPDGVLLASGDRAGNLYVFEARNGGEFYTLSGHKDAITALAFRDDSNVLASASQDGTVKLWDMTSGNALASISAHAGPSPTSTGALDVAFAHDGKLVTCGRDAKAKLWGPDGAALKGFEAFPDIVLHAAATHDGSRVVAGDWSGQVRVYKTADGAKAGDLSANPPTDAALLPPAPAGAAKAVPAEAKPEAKPQAAALAPAPAAAKATPAPAKPPATAPAPAAAKATPAQAKAQASAPPPVAAKATPAPTKPPATAPASAAAKATSAQVKPPANSPAALPVTAQASAPTPAGPAAARPAQP